MAIPLKNVMWLLKFFSNSATHINHWEEATQKEENSLVKLGETDD